MYSIVMMAALAPAADTPVAPKVADPAPAVVLGGCSGSGISYGSCSGGVSYGSCHGGGGHRRVLGGHRAACHGGGYSCSGYNCFGSANSCFGSAGIAGYGTSYGSSWGPPIGMPPYTLHGYNAGGVWGAGPPVPAYADAGHGYGPNQPPVMAIPVAPPTKGSDGAPVGANIKFVLPADAKLYVDGKLTVGSGTERTFYTPPLAAGQQFYYDVKVETVVAGKPVVEEKKIIVTAGANVTEEFGKATVAGR